MKDIILAHGFTIRLQHLKIIGLEKGPKTNLLLGAAINVKGIRIWGKYPQRMCLLTINSGRVYNTKLKKYCLTLEDYNSVGDFPYGQNTFRNKGVLRRVFITKGMEKFLKKEEYMDYEQETIESILEKELIDKYFPTFDLIVNFSKHLYEYEEAVSKVIDTKTARYFNVSRKIELAHKIRLVRLLAPTSKNEENYDYYYIEIMSEFGNSFIELKQFARITKKFVKIEKKENARVTVLKRMKKVLGEEYPYKNEDEEKGFVCMAEIVKEWEEKYKG